MTEQRFLRLLELYKANELSPDEKQEWSRAIDSGEHEAILTREIQKDFDTHGTHPLWTMELKSTVFDRIRKATALEEINEKRNWTAAEEQEEETALPRISRFLRWTAAAAVLLFASGTYLYFHQQQIPNQLTTVNRHPSTVNEIQPGTNRAVLTLANGSKIILDSVHNGVLAQQAGSEIIKTDSGKLSYTVNRQLPIDNPSDQRSTINDTRFATNTLTTPRGGQFQLSLPDGTKVWLNAASSITYPTAFIANTRNVSITGEVYFEVAHDVSHPFIVSIPSTVNRFTHRSDSEGGQPTTIQVLGTHFNVNAYPDEISVKTTLLEGSVKITKDRQSGILKPGQQAIVDNDKTSVKIFNDPDLEQVMAWKNGEISLTNATVGQIMMDISRWYDVDVKYTGAAPNKKFFGSIDRNVPLSTVLKCLKSYGVETTLEGKTIIVQ